MGGGNGALMLEREVAVMSQYQMVKIAKEVASMVERTRTSNGDNFFITMLKKSRN